MQLQPVAGVIIEKEGKVLLHRRDYEPARGKLDFVGGFVDPGETPEEAAVREAKEETGFDVALLEKWGAFQYYKNDDKIAHMFFADIVSGNQSGSVEGEPVWVDMNALPHEELAFPHTKAFLQKYIRERKKHTS